jgi:dimethylargininase
LRIFDFDHALVRTPGHSVVHGLRSDADAVPDLDGIVREHRAYVAALEAAGLAVDILPPLEAFPDSVFVEDPALVFPDGAILLRPGAPSRLGEREAMRDALQRYFEQLIELQGDEYADGGDVLVTPEAVLIGLSKRTNRRGAEALCTQLTRLGQKAKIVETPQSVLHFKTAVSLLDEETVLATESLAKSGIFAGFRTVIVPEGEEEAANALRVNDTVLLGAQFLRTIERVMREGFAVKALEVGEVGKLDAGLSCMSLRWLARR